MIRTAKRGGRPIALRLYALSEAEGGVKNSTFFSFPTLTGKYHVWVIFKTSSGEGFGWCPWKSAALAYIARRQYLVRGDRLSLATALVSCTMACHSPGLLFNEALKQRGPADLLAADSASNREK